MTLGLNSMPRAQVEPTAIAVATLQTADCGVMPELSRAALPLGVGIVIADKCKGALPSFSMYCRTGAEAFVTLMGEYKIAATLPVTFRIRIPRYSAIKRSPEPSRL